MEPTSFTFWSNCDNSEVFLDKLRSECRRMSAGALWSLEDTLHRALLLVRTSLNNASGINRLPSEILRTIFQDVLGPVEGKKTFRWPSSQLRSTRGRSTLAEVCHVWREICLDCAALWSHIVDISPGSFRHSLPIILSRSKSTPLKVLLTADDLPWMDNLLRTNGARIQELFVWSFTNTNVHRRLDFAAPALEQLTIAGNGPISTDFHPLLCMGNTPKLQSLTLWYTYWTPNNCFRSLKQLCCRFKSHSTSHAVNLQSSNIIRFLSGCPNLEDVILVLPYNHVAQDIAEDSPSVTLSRLKRLVLDGPRPERNAWLLRHLSIPAGVSIRIMKTTATNVLRLARVLPSLPVVRGFTSLCIQFSGMRIEMHLPFTSIANVSPFLCKLYPLTDIRELHIDVAGYRLPDRRSVDPSCIFPYLELSAFPSLSKLVYHHPTQAGNPPHCPDLATLHVRLGRSRLMFDVVVEFSKARAEAGYPLHEVVVGFDGEDAHMTALQRSSGTAQMRADWTPSQLQWPATSTAAPHEYWAPW
ncbi:hypothetical protein SCP_1800250 [Sparassis crispa]|uniref:F-box domain-containing protein n=1 Tax=Sparassis crispa TaxID=139825 RepID=A0A401H6K1_9APHY|nr:hypothetical protein SCP_1800250 [Sparassis crispa]GBE90003.1 hypothetical protein SCP_1800250 [Sparassis crispa]